jgi:hypothetical protein
MSLKFSETRIEEGPGSVRLLDAAGGVILELHGSEIDDAVRDGLYDPDRGHGSLYEYARMIADLGPMPAPDPDTERDFDDDFLASIDIRWD